MNQKTKTSKRVLSLITAIFLFLTTVITINSAFIRSVHAEEPGEVVVENWKQLKDAVEDDTAEVIALANNIEIKDTLKVLRAVTITSQQSEATEEVDIYTISRANNYYGNGKMFEVNAEKDAAGSIVKKGALTLSNITLDGGITEDISIAMGSLIMVGKDAELHLKTGAVLKNNRMTAKNDGGAVYLYGMMTMEDSIIENNSTGQYGGGICVNRGGFLDVRKNSIIRNNTALYGGGIYTDHADVYDVIYDIPDKFARISLKDSEISENKARYSSSTGSSTTIGYGGGLYIGQYTEVVAFEGMTITNNTAGAQGEMEHCGFGGGIYFDSRYAAKSLNHTITVKNSAISGNKVYSTLDDVPLGGRGGGVYIGYNDPITFEQCEVENNSSDYYGGGIYYTASGNAELVGCTIKNNTALYGGGIYADGYVAKPDFPNLRLGELSIIGGSITGNTASETAVNGESDLSLVAMPGKVCTDSVVLAGEPVIGVVTSANWSAYNLKVGDDGLKGDAAIGYAAQTGTFIHNESAFIMGLKESEAGYFSQLIANQTGTPTLMNNLNDKGEPLGGERDHSLVMVLPENPQFPSSLRATRVTDLNNPKDLVFTLDKAFADTAAVKVSFTDSAAAQPVDILPADYTYDAESGTLTIPGDKLSKYLTSTGDDKKLTLFLGFTKSTPNYFIELEAAFVVAQAQPVADVIDPAKPVSVVINTYNSLHAQDMGVTVDGTELTINEDYSVTEENGIITAAFSQDYIKGLKNKTVNGYEIAFAFTKNGEEYGEISAEMKVAVPPSSSSDSEDLLFRFNRNIADYAECTINGFKIAQEKQADGSCELYLDGELIGKVYAGSTVVRLYADYIETLPEGTYSLKVFFREGDGQTFEAVDFMVQTDSKPLSDTVKEAEDVLDDADIGDKPGQYPQDAADKLEDVIEKAKEILDAPNSSQNDMDKAKDDLQKAIDEFEDSEIPTGDTDDSDNTDNSDDTDDSDNTDDTDDTIDNPPTGDNIKITSWFILCAVSLLIFCGLLAGNKKRKYRAVKK